MTRALLLAALLLTGCAGLPLGHLDMFSPKVREDFRQVGIIATQGGDAVGVQCSADAEKLFTTVDALKMSTGFFFADIEMQRVAQQSPLPLRWRKFKDSCAPLFMGQEKFIAALHLPHNTLKMLGE